MMNDEWNFGRKINENTEGGEKFKKYAFFCVLKYIHH